MKRLLTSLAIAIFAITIAPMQVLAANTATTGAWTWTDVSDYVSNRTNRPIWAIAHANSGWFYTDGQNLWNGGQVYRFDGNTNVTVTNDVRNAGLDRVDDIVSDGADTALFLQDVVRTDNQFRIVVNKNGTYYNATDIVRGMLYSDEGISSISGKNGTWYFVTTKSRLFRWYANSSSPVQISLPSAVTSYSYQTAQSMIYSVGQTTFRGMKIVPIGSDWMLMTQSQGNWLTYKYSGSSFTDITSTVFPNTKGTDVLFSNGTTAIYAEGTYSYQNGRLAQYNGSSLYETTINSGVFTSSIAAAAWDGTSWIIVSGNKEIVRILPYTSTVESIGVSRDYFITAAGDNNGHLLLGGTASQLGTNGPTYPLTAKLVMITENGATNITNTDTSSNNSTTDSVTGIKNWEWLDPNTALATNGQTTYHIGTWDGDGMKRIEIYVNGAVKKTCESNFTDCNITLYGSEYTVGTNIFVNAKLTDAKNQSTWSSGLTVYRTSDTSTTDTATNTSSNTNANIWTWIDPNKTSFNSNEDVTFYAGAWDVDGVAQIILSVNGTDIRTCQFNGETGNVQCAATIYASNYSADTTLTLRARIIDRNINTVWSEQKSIYRNGTSSTTNTSGGSVWTWVEPTKTTLYSDESVVFSAGAQDNDGINRIILTINGSDVRTCSFNGSTGTSECSYTVYGSTYSANSTITLRARAIDANGTVTWSNTQQIYRYSGASSNSSSNTSNSTASVWTWTEPSLTSINPNESVVFYAGAWDGDGINQVILSVNGGDKKTCTLGGTQSAPSCAYTVVANDYSANTNLVLRARIVDKNGATTWSTEQDIYRNAGSGTTNTNTSAGTISTWEWVEPTLTSLEVQNTTTYHANAWSASAIKSIVVYVNGSIVKTCTFNKTVLSRDCSYSIVGRNYGVGSEVFMNALITDHDGNQVWNTNKTITIIADSTSSQNNNSNGWVNVITNRDGGFTAGQSITITVTSDDADGVARSEIYINGTRTAICNNSKTCSTTVMPPSAGNYFNYAGTMVDKYGAVITTGYKQITRK